MKIPSQAKNLALYAFLVAASLLTLLPVWWVVVASFNVGSSAFNANLWPTQFTLANYHDIFQGYFGRWLLNSIGVSLATAVISVLITALAAYAFARMRFFGRRLGIVVIFIIQMFPASMYLVAIYSILSDIHLEGTLTGLVLVYSGAQAFNIWLLRSYINSIPKELDEAAMVDGASRWLIFWRIILPLSRPMLVTLFIWSIMGSYNEFMIASLVLQGGPQTYTVAVGLRSLIANQYATNWTLFAAGAVIATFPIMFIYLALQKQLLSGLTRGAVNL
ncbi:MAG: sugar ABC transporter permease [Sulfobacillus sp.]|nr:sugar ABC transporter permease [Sulfobacillus sp.]